MVHVASVDSTFSRKMGGAMGARHRQRQGACADIKPADIGKGRARALKGATLALICERGSHGYELAARLQWRLGPAWRITPKDMYPILDQLERAGLITPVEQAGGGRQRIIVYHPTERAPEALSRWMDGALRPEALRSDVRARIAVAKPGDLQRALLLLEDYEDQILHLIEATHDAEPPQVRSWETLLRDITRAGADVHLQAELAWIVDSRRRFLEYSADSRLAD